MQRNLREPSTQKATQCVTVANRCQTLRTTPGAELDALREFVATFPSPLRAFEDFVGDESACVRWLGTFYGALKRFERCSEWSSASERLLRDFRVL